MTIFVIVGVYVCVFMNSSPVTEEEDVEWGGKRVSLILVSVQTLIRRFYVIVLVQFQTSGFKFRSFQTSLVVRIPISFTYRTKNL